MTAKKKATSSPKSKPAKPKPTKAAAAGKKKVSKPAAPKKSAPAKAKPAKKPAAAKATAKPVQKSALKKAASKPVKKTAPAKAAAKPKVSKPAGPSKVKKKAQSSAPKTKPKKTSSGAVPAKKKDSKRISKVKEIVTQTLGKSQKEERKAESNSFSFDDALSFLKSKKKSVSKKKSSKESSEIKVSKVEKVQETKKSKVKKLTTASIDDILGFGTPTVGNARPLRDETKVPKQWLPYYKTLMSLRNALKGSLGERSSETIGASARESGELSINSSDAGTETFDRDLALSMVANDQEALEEIEDAIDRIFDGTYGICLETKKPINKNRLKAVPFTRFSVEGQNQFERGKIKEKDFGSGSFATLADSTMGEED